MQSGLQLSLLAGASPRLTGHKNLCTTSAPFASGQRLCQLSCHSGTAREGRGLTLATRATAATNFGDERFYSSSSSLLGPPPPVAGGQRPDARGAAHALNIEDVQLESEVGMDYQPLKALLAEGAFQKADDETRAKLIQLAGDDAVSQGFVYFTQVRNMPEKDLRTMDNLWKAGSNGKFGYSVQKDIYGQCGKSWTKFLRQIGWVSGEHDFYKKWPQEFTYTLDAPKGHLPLTNALRGTNLFEELMKHPAFNPPQQAPLQGGVSQGLQNMMTGA